MIHKRLPTIAVCASLSLMLLASAGCKQRTPVVSVSGTAKFADGSNLPEGTRIVLAPIEGHQGSASGEVDNEGAFSLKHQDGRTGAEEGEYGVYLLAPSISQADFYKVVPKEYTEVGSLKAKISRDENQLSYLVPKAKVKK